eukprot:1885942-Pyramimonas_sp.AAC.1
MAQPAILAFHKSVMKEAARVARGTILFVSRSIGRAVWKQGRGLAEKLKRSHPLARRFIRVQPLSGAVEITDPDTFTIFTNELNFRLNQAAVQRARLQAGESSLAK